MMSSAGHPVFIVPAFFLFFYWLGVWSASKQINISCHIFYTHVYMDTNMKAQLIVSEFVA